MKTVNINAPASAHANNIQKQGVKIMRNMRKAITAVLSTSAAILAAAMFFTCSTEGDGVLNQNALRTLNISRNHSNGGSISVDGRSMSSSSSSIITTHSNNASVSVCATAANNFTFTGWSGASTSSNSCVTITMNENKSLTANFQQQSSSSTTYTLTVTRDPTAGGTVTVNGSTTSGSTTHNSGVSVTVCANANSGYTFTGWSGASTSSSSCVEITMNSNRSLTANFNQQTQQPTQRTLTVTRTPAAGGTVTVNGSTTSGTTTHNNNASVQVCANANSGYTFTGWSGASTSSSSCVEITMNSNRSLTANFNQQTQQPTQRTLTVTRTPAAGGTVTVNGTTTSGTTTHNNNASVQVCANANSGYTFTYWSGAESIHITTLCVTLTMSQDRSLTANFVLVPPINYGSFTDARDGKTYRTVRIGNRTWMADNLNYDTLNGNGSWCNGNEPSNCNLYGRLYNWPAAMNISRDFLTTQWGGSDVNHQGICPAGWRVPNNADWDALIMSVGGWQTAGTRLKSQTWNPNGNRNGADDFGFSALPGGTRGGDAGFFGLNVNGYWWSSTESSYTGAMELFMHINSEHTLFRAGVKYGANSVRCVRD